MTMRREDLEAPQYFATDIGISFKHSGFCLIVNTDVPTIQQPGGPPAGQPVSRRACQVWFSPEHLKVFSFVLWRALVQYQKDMGWSIPALKAVLDSINATEEQWLAYWGESEPSSNGQIEAPSQEQASENQAQGADVQATPARATPGVIGG